MGLFHLLPLSVFLTALISGLQILGIQSLSVKPRLENQVIKTTISTTTPTFKPSTTPAPLPSATPTAQPTLTPTSTPAPTASPGPVPSAAPVSANNSNLSGEVLDLFNALNNYRAKNGVNTLAWDSKLADFAQTRANSFNQNRGLDNHAGFLDFINNQNGFQKLGFYKLGENSSWNISTSAVDLIEQVYTQDSGHKQNELNPGWSHIGIGVAGTSTDFIFGGNKM